LREFVDLSKEEMIGLLGEEGGKKAWQFIHLDSRRVGFGGLPAIGAASSTKAAVVS
jgi:hypothetical protein